MSANASICGAKKPPHVRSFCLDYSLTCASIFRPFLKTTRLHENDNKRSKHSGMCERAHRGCALTELRALLHHWSHRSLSLVLKDPAASHAATCLCGVSGSDGVEARRTWRDLREFTQKEKVVSFPGEEDEGRTRSPCCRSDSLMHECVSEEATPISSLSLFLSLRAGCLCLSPPSSPPPLPPLWCEAELTSSDVVVTEAECDSRSPDVATQQGHQFP